MEKNLFFLAKSTKSSSLLSPDIDINRDVPTIFIQPTKTASGIVSENNIKNDFGSVCAVSSQPVPENKENQIVNPQPISIREDDTKQPSIREDDTKQPINPQSTGILQSEQGQSKLGTSEQRRLPFRLHASEQQRIQLINQEISRDSPIPLSTRLINLAVQRVIETEQQQKQYFPLVSPTSAQVCRIIEMELRRCEHAVPIAVAEVPRQPTISNIVATSIANQV